MRKVVTSQFSLYLLVWASLCILLILFFKTAFCNGPENKLKWKTDIENLYKYLHVICRQLVPSLF